MTRIAYCNGRYIPRNQAAISLEDRGFNFADGVYEYIAFYNGIFLDLQPHVERLGYSLSELGIPLPVHENALPLIMNELVAQNHMRHGGLYLQVTRGAARRDHPYPKRARPTLTMTLYPPKAPTQQALEQGIKVVTAPDIRWGRCDIKSLALLANVLVKQEAVAAGAKEAWLHRGGTFTEGAVSNIYIITPENVLVTHPADTHILNGIARRKVLELARKKGMKVEERAFTMAELKSAKEALQSSTTVNIMPVTEIDGKTVGNGHAGEITLSLVKQFQDYVTEETGYIYS